MCMVFNFSDFIECYKIGNINKQFYRIVLNIIPILTQINFYNTTFYTVHQINRLEKILNLKETKNITTLNLELSSDKRAIEDIWEALERNNTLTKLNISNNSVWSIDIARLFRNNTTLLILELSGIGFLDEVIPFNEALKKNTTLTTLELSCNTISTWIIIAIATALEINNTLTTLILSFNDVGYHGAKAIAKAVKINKTLTLLDLRCCNIGYDGAIAIAEAVKKNKTLTLLDLRDCNIGYRGAKAIAEALKTNTRIQIITT